MPLFVTRLLYWIAFFRQVKPVSWIGHVYGPKQHITRLYVIEHKDLAAPGCSLAHTVTLVEFLKRFFLRKRPKAHSERHPAAPWATSE